MNREICKLVNQRTALAMLNGTQNQHRWPARVQPLEKDWILHTVIGDAKMNGQMFFAKPGDVVFTEGVNRSKYFKTRFQPGDTVCFRERARLVEYYYESYMDNPPQECVFVYEADKEKKTLILPERIKPIKIGHCCPNGCFKELVRIKRPVIRSWFEQVQDISRADVLAEGVDLIHIEKNEKFFHKDDCHGLAFCEVWNSVYPGTYEKNIWIECIEFKGI